MEIKDLLLILVGPAGLGIGGFITTWLMNKNKHEVNLLDRSYDEIKRQDEVIKEVRKENNELRQKIIELENRKE